MIKDLLLKLPDKMTVSISIAIGGLSGSMLFWAATECAKILIPRLTELLPKGLLLASSIGLGILVLVMGAWITALHIKHKERMFLKFGVLWDSDLNPRCPNCQSIAMCPVDFGKNKHGYFCSSCRSESELRDRLGAYVTLESAIQAIEKGKQ